MRQFCDGFRNFDIDFIKTGNKIQGDFGFSTFKKKKKHTTSATEQQVLNQRREEQNKQLYVLTTSQDRWYFDAYNKLRQNMCVHVCAPNNILLRRC